MAFYLKTVQLNCLYRILACTEVNMQIIVLAGPLLCCGEYWIW